MPRAPSPIWHARSGQDLDSVIQRSIDKAGTPDASGKYADCKLTEIAEFCGHIPTPASATKSECWSETKGNGKCELHEVVKQLYNAARRKNVSLPWPEIIKSSDGTWEVRYCAWHKKAGRAIVTETAKGDRANLAYDPRKKESKDKK